MTVIEMGACLIIGVILLIIGICTKKKWIKLVAMISLAIAMINIVLLLGMGMN